MKSKLLRQIIRMSGYAICVVCIQCLFFTLASANTDITRGKGVQLTSAEVEISGKITDEFNQGLPGVSVVIKGTATGTVTDLNGDFKLITPDDAVLSISYIGYKVQQISVVGRSVINIQLEPDIELLQEVVVVGYGTQNKRDLTGAIGSIKTLDIVRANPIQAASALQGQVAGVNINKIKGRPGDGFTIDIRGLSDFTGSSEPLVVIDGVMGADMNNLNPNDIASMDVLKDASSTAIYGSRGADGVIIITTKRGVSGKPKVSYNAYVGVKTPTHLPDMMDAQQFYNTYNVIRPAETGSNPRGWTDSEIANAEGGKTVDWLDLVTDPALQTSHTISLTGGSDNTTYDFSAGYLEEKGNTLHTGFKRYTLKGGMQSEIGDKVKVGFTSYFTHGNQALSSTEALRSAFRSRPTGTVFFDDLLPADQAADKNWNGYAVFMGIDDNQVINPLVEIDPENFQRGRRNNSVIANGFVDYTPIKGLSLRSSISAAVSNTKTGDYRGTYTKSQKTTRAPKANLVTSDIASYTLDNIVTYNLNSGDHNLTVTGLHSVFEQRLQQSRIAAENLPYRSLWYHLGDGTVTDWSTNLEERAITSYMGRVNYSFRGKYFLTLTGRSDGASQLSDGNKWQFFPSAAFAWRLGDEEFIKNTKLISDLKLRVSYGEVGSTSGIAPYETQSSIVQTQYDFGGSTANGFAINSLSNKDLVWQRSKEINFGLDMGIFDNRITASVEVYNRKTVDLILPDKIPNSTGFSGLVANVGEIKNSGVEVLLNTVNVVQNDFKWTSTITFTKNNNEVTKLEGGLTEDPGNNRFVGEAVNAIFLWEVDGIWQLDEADQALSFGQEPGEVKLVDQDGDGAITDDDRVIIGSETPDFLMGVRNRIEYKNFDFSFFVYTRQGVQWGNNYLRGTFGDLSSDRYNRDASIDFWTSNNPSNTFYGLGGAGLASHPSKPGNNTRKSLTVTDANFVRVSDITLGYTLPTSALEHLGFSHLRVYAQASNPFIFTDYTGFNPEYNSGVNNDDVPFSTFIFGVNASF